MSSTTPLELSIWASCVSGTGTPTKVSRPVTPSPCVGLRSGVGGGWTYSVTYSQASVAGSTAGLGSEVQRGIRSVARAIPPGDCGVGSKPSTASPSTKRDRYTQLVSAEVRNQQSPVRSLPTLG